MLFIRKREGVIQNLGWFDRILRVTLSGVMLGVPVYIIELNQPGFWLFVSMLLAVYPLLTGIIGVDPIYNSLNIRTCDTSKRNQCGTFPFEVDAALGHNPIPLNDVEHSLEHSRHSA